MKRWKLLWGSLLLGNALCVILMWPSMFIAVNTVAAISCLIMLIWFTKGEK